MRVVRTIAVLGLVVAVAGPGLGTFVARAAADKDACAGHVCQCRTRHCPPKRTAGSNCHGRADARASCEMRGTCRHDQEASAPGGTVWAATEARSNLEVPASGPFRRSLRSAVAPGFFRIDPRPPRRG